MLSRAYWEGETKQFSVVSGNLPGTGSQRVSKARGAEESVATVRDDCSSVSDFFAKRYPKSQSQPHWMCQLSQYPDLVLSGAMGGKCLGKGKNDVVEVGRKSNGR